MGLGAAAARGQGEPQRRYVPLGGLAWPFTVGFSFGGRERLQRPVDHLQGEPRRSGVGSGAGSGGR